MDTRIEKLSDLLTDYARGKFNRHSRLSGPDDAINACIEGANMTGEELKHTAITRDYFTAIFNSVSDMILVLSPIGIIRDTNLSASRQLRYKPEELTGKCIDRLQPGDVPLISSLFREAYEEKGKASLNTRLLLRNGETLPVQVTAGSLEAPTRRQKEILLTIRDTTQQLEAEKKVIRAVIDAQETERNRLALDLHDSLGQQVIGIRFCLDGLLQREENEQHKAILSELKGNLTQVLEGMRDTCFQLMPRSLEEFDLLGAVHDLCFSLELSGKVRLRVEADPGFPELSKALSIDIFRIVQEFSANALRHGHAGNIRFAFHSVPSGVRVELSDDGAGFDKSRIHQGRGLQNARSHVESHNGDICMRSLPGRGTQFTISFPIS